MEEGRFSSQEISGYAHPERIEALPKEVSWSASLDSVLTEAHLRALRLHHPPRSRSEAPAFVPPPRVKDETKVLHPIYAPYPRYRARKASLPISRVTTDVSSFAREECGFVPLSFGIRKAPVFPLC